MASVHAVCVGDVKGTRKASVGSIELREEFGVAGDAHGGSERQVSLLAMESVGRMKKKLATLAPGDFAENIATVGIDLASLLVGTRLTVGGEVLLEITQIGKTCHHDCDIKKKVGYCVMPTQGVFARVLRGGVVKPGDEITLGQAPQP